MRPSPELRLAIDSRLENVRLLSMAVRGACAELGLSERALGEVELCVAEAVTNCIEHGYDSQPGHPIEALVVSEEDALVISLVDHGRPIPEDRLPPPEPEIPDDPLLLPEGGRGLFLLFAMMDRVEYERGPGGNKLTLVKHYTGDDDEG